MDYPVNDSDYNSNQKPNSTSYPMEGTKLRTQEIPTIFQTCNDILNEVSRIEGILDPVLFHSEVDFNEADEEIKTPLQNSLDEILKRVISLRCKIKL